MLLLVVNTFALPATASMTIVVYSPVASKKWYYTQYDHGGYLGSQRDVAGTQTSTPWSLSDVVTFSTSPTIGVQGYVEWAGTNCGTGGPDKYVILQIWADGLYYGKVGYIHIKSLNPGVQTGQWINPGKVLGPVQDAQSWHNGVLCWKGLHVHMEKDMGSWYAAGLCGDQNPPPDPDCSGNPYSQPLITFSSGIAPLSATVAEEVLRLTDWSIPLRAPAH